MNVHLDIPKKMLYAEARRDARGSLRKAKQAFATANRDRIARFEEKIKTTLVCVWGEETPTAPEAMP